MTVLRWWRYRWAAGWLAGTGYLAWVVHLWEQQRL